MDGHNLTYNYVRTLVRVIDKVNSDPILNAKCKKRGDVISICPDGWQWGEGELSNPQWTIIKLPNVSIEEASIFLGPEIDTDPVNPNPALQSRAFKIDLDRIPSILPAKISTLNHTFNTLLGFKVKKASLTNPFIT